MKKKTNIRTIIRQIVREEVAMAIQEVITELKQPTQDEIKPIQEKSYSKNSVLNEVLNETAASEDWKTLGGGTYDSSRANEVLSSQYGDMMNGNTNAPVSVDGQTPDFLTKDYSQLLKKVDEKAKQKRGQ